ncbi:MFS transporter, SP family [Enterococcus faecium 13.SD.W.09]|nr:MFS transporter, SP family [Enterococcus faecium 13.SD.W.09]
MIKKNIQYSYYIIAIGGFLTGYLTSVIAGVLPFMATEFSLSTTQEGLVSSIVLFGGILGALFGGQFANVVGRKKAMMLFALICTIGVLGASLLNQIALILVFRFIMGMAVGAMSGLVPIYLSELAPSTIRGQVASINSVLCTLGIFLSYVANNVFFDSGNWRVMNLLSLIACAILLLGFFIIPESPEWLLAKGKYEKAREISLLIFGTQDQLNVTEKEAIKEEETDTPIKEKYQAWMMRPIMLCVYVVAFQKITGANSVLFYAPKILEAAGLPSKLASQSTLGIGLIMFGFTFVCQKLIDKEGRKVLLLFGNLTMGVILLLLGIFTQVSSIPGFVLVILVFLFIASYATTWGVVPWVLLGEMLPMVVKGVGSSLATGSTWIADAVITLMFPILLNLIHINNIFFIFGVLNILSFFFVRKFITETKGKTQTEISAEEKQRWELKHKLTITENQPVKEK